MNEEHADTLETEEKKVNAKLSLAVRIMKNLNSFLLTQNGEGWEKFKKALLEIIGEDIKRFLE